jgi:hypothetical protein
MKEMQSRFAVAAVVCGLCVYAQTPDDPVLSHARAEVERVRTMVESGVLPRNQLLKAEGELADAADANLLRHTLYGQDLTVEQAGEMLAAAQRRVDRRTQAVADDQALVAAGAASKQSLEALEQDVASAQKEYELAESRAHLVNELADMGKNEVAFEARLSETPETAHEIAEHYEGDGEFSPSTLGKVETAFAAKFGKVLPISALGETAVHRALGFDHRGRVDVAIHPDQPEGVWLHEYLIDHHIPFYAFRQAVPGKATGAHFHLGPGSTRLKLGG